MLTEQSIPTQPKDEHSCQDDPSPATLLRDRKPGWIISLIHYFAFGVDAYLLETIAQRSAVASDPISANPIHLPAESNETTQPENSVGLPLRKYTYTRNKVKRRRLITNELNIING